MLIFDANVWIALLNVEDSQHEKAKMTYVEVEENQESILLPEYIILEVLNVLTCKAGKSKADTFLSKIFASDQIEIGYSSDDFLLRVIQTFLASDSNKLSFIDQSLLYLSQFHKVITFDKEILKRLPKVA
jgi:predicted nucleic acid-binding protein